MYITIIRQKYIPVAGPRFPIVESADPIGGGGLTSDMGTFGWLRMQKRRNRVCLGGGHYDGAPWICHCIRKRKNWGGGGWGASPSSAN